MGVRSNPSDNGLPLLTTGAASPVHCRGYICVWVGLGSTFNRQVHHELSERLRRVCDSRNTFVGDDSTTVQSDESPSASVHQKWFL